MIHFPPDHNCETACGERATLSVCNYFRLTDCGEFWAHFRGTKLQPWQLVPGAPFGSLSAALAACERVAERERLPRKRGQVMRQLERAKIDRRKRKAGV